MSNATVTIHLFFSSLIRADLQPITMFDGEATRSSWYSIHTYTLHHPCNTQSGTQAGAWRAPCLRTEIARICGPFWKIQIRLSDVAGVRTPPSRIGLVLTEIRNDFTTAPWQRNCIYVSG
jgi:hypothetical protein